MIEKVSPGQGMMAVVKAVSVWLIFVVGGCGGCIYLVSTKVFMQADSLAQQAAAAARPGVPLKDLLSTKSKFMVILSGSHLLSLDVGNPSESMSGGNRDCGSLAFYNKDRVTFQRTGVTSPAAEFSTADGHDWGTEFVEKHTSELKKCNLISTNVMKSTPRHCPLLVEYDRDLKVVRASTKPCWD